MTVRLCADVSVCVRAITTMTRVTVRVTDLPPSNGTEIVLLTADDVDEILNDIA